MLKEVTVLNLRKYLQILDDDGFGENELQNLLSDFSCEKNRDVEEFLKYSAIEFTKKNQSVTYLVFLNEDASLVGYFTLAIKPICIKADRFSNTMKRKIARVSVYDADTGTYTLSAYLIAQLGKNFSNGLNEKISGNQLLQAAIETIEELQYMAGGMVAFLEAEPSEKLINFYEKQNGFKPFDTRMTRSDHAGSHTLIQLLKII